MKEPKYGYGKKVAAVKVNRGGKSFIRHQQVGQAKKERLAKNSKEVSEDDMRNFVNKYFDGKYTGNEAVPSILTSRNLDVLLKDAGKTPDSYSFEERQSIKKIFEKYVDNVRTSKLAHNAKEVRLEKADAKRNSSKVVSKKGEFNHIKDYEPGDDESRDISDDVDEYKSRPKENRLGGGNNKPINFKSVEKEIRLREEIKRYRNQLKEVGDSKAIRDNLREAEEELKKLIKNY